MLIVYYRLILTIITYINVWNGILDGMFLYILSYSIHIYWNLMDYNTYIAKYYHFNWFLDHNNIKVCAPYYY